MAKFFEKGAKTAPSQYPKLLFHGIRCFQLVASVIVGAITAYFVWHLTQDDQRVPWTFIWLLSASLASVAVLAFTIVLHCFTGLNPRLNIGLNACLAILWALSWSLLTYYMRGTLGNMCDPQHWEEDVGIMICRIYKALFTFTLVGLIATLAALGLDFYVRRKQTSRGIYQLHDLDSKARPDAARGPYTDQSGAYGGGGLAAPRDNDNGGSPRPSTGPYNEQSDRLMYDADTRYHSRSGSRADEGP